jgi:hypothetical protein
VFFGRAKEQFAVKLLRNLEIIQARLQCDIGYYAAIVPIAGFFPCTKKLSSESFRIWRNIRAGSLVYTGAADFGAVQV